MCTCVYIYHRPLLGQSSYTGYPFNEGGSTKLCIIQIFIQSEEILENL